MIHLTKENEKTITASDWIKRNVNDTTLALSDESARLFMALSIGGFSCSTVRTAGVNLFAFLE